MEEYTVERVRMITPTEWHLYERQVPDEGGSPREGDQWVEVNGGENALGFVPVVPIPIGRYHRPYLCKPPFLDLAYLNVRHWQSYSDQANILAKARFAMLAFAGDSQIVRVDAAGNPVDDGTLVVGPSTVLSGGQGSQWYYVEPKGDGPTQGFKDLERLELQRGAMALMPFMAQKSGKATATAKAIDTSQANSEVQAWALILKDALEYCWAIHCAWLDLPKDQGPEVEVNTDYGLSMGDSEFANLMRLRAMGELSRKTLWREAQRRTILSPSFDADVEEGRLLEEGPGLLQQGLPGAPQPNEGGFQPDQDGTGGFAEPLLGEEEQGAPQASSRFMADGVGLQVIRGA